MNPSIEQSIALVRAAADDVEANFHLPHKPFYEALATWLRAAAELEQAHAEKCARNGWVHGEPEDGEEWKAAVLLAEAWMRQQSDPEGN